MKNIWGANKTHSDDFWWECFPTWLKCGESVTRRIIYIYTSTLLHFPVSLFFPNSDRTLLCFHRPTHHTETTLGILFFSWNKNFESYIKRFGAISNLEWDTWGNIQKSLVFWLVSWVSFSLCRWHNEYEKKSYHISFAVARLFSISILIRNLIMLTIIYSQHY